MDVITLSVKIPVKMEQVLNIHVITCKANLVIHTYFAYLSIATSMFFTMFYLLIYIDAFMCDGDFKIINKKKMSRKIKVN